MNREAEPPAMVDELDTEAVENLCDSLAERAAFLADAVSKGWPWALVSHGLLLARQGLDELTEVYNDFERDVERRYAPEIAASEEP